nr:uncharacterized protein LOC113817844 [Penaeus vannamei]
MQEHGPFPLFSIPCRTADPDEAQEEARSVPAGGRLQQGPPHLLGEAGQEQEVELLAFLEVPLLPEASQTKVDDRGSHSLPAPPHAHVLRGEVQVRHAGPVHALEGAAQLLEDVLLLGGGQQPLLHAVPQRGTGKAAHGDAVLVLDHHGLQLLQPLLAPEPEQGPNRSIRFRASLRPALESSVATPKAPRPSSLARQPSVRSWNSALDHKGAATFLRKLSTEDEADSALSPGTISPSRGALGCERSV